SLARRLSRTRSPNVASAYGWRSKNLASGCNSSARSARRVSLGKLTQQYYQCCASQKHRQGIVSQRDKTSDAQSEETAPVGGGDPWRDQRSEDCCRHGVKRDFNPRVDAIEPRQDEMAAYPR